MDNETNDLGRVPDGDQALVNEAVTHRHPAGFDPSRYWTLQFDAPAGSRILGSRFFGIEVGFGDSETPFDRVLWWDRGNRVWRDGSDKAHAVSSSANCRSFKAFKQHPRRHADKLMGRRVRLVSRYFGHDIWAVPAQGMETGAVETLSAPGEA